MLTSTCTASITLLLLVAGLGPTGGSLPVAPAALPATSGCEVPWNGEWGISTDEQVVCEDRMLEVRNITIRRGASLTLRNVELVVDTHTDANGNRPANGIQLVGNIYGLVPHLGGSLYVYDSLIRSSDPAMKLDGIRMAGGTTLVMHDSEVRDAHAAVNTATGVQRLEVRGSRISSSWAGIAPWYSENVFIEGNLFTGPGHGIWGQGPVGIIRDNTFTGCYTGIYLYGDNAMAREITGNTITNCKGGLLTNNCEPREAHYNDVYRNLDDWGRGLPTMESAFCGDLENNWWGEEGPRPERFGRPADHTPWLTEPAHPERLPHAEMAAPDTFVVGVPAVFSAEGSRPSQTWESPLASFRWDFGPGPDRAGETVTHTFHRPGTYQVTLLVTDELGISRMAMKDVTVVHG